MRKKPGAEKGGDRPVLSLPISLSLSGSRLLARWDHKLCWSALRADSASLGNGQFFCYLVVTVLYGTLVFLGCTDHALVKNGKKGAHQITNMNEVNK